ncbi:uncharacterized protein LOC102809117 [Saccoglossus kowalevskii]|uniref:Uncharacterized threonine-rich GPI-anchored glycoprotein PJ4664.02-like n=1 Tax=Saccoglossus kowalevskii TaxID=10224 RepID=A0ABM0MYD3_SACKO|nr:PREDICTED: uncharacterized threonine-rich GPI-anchored glycoprotein PJ4664.02-like [Saccoglossus kowalevskii]
MIVGDSSIFNDENLPLEFEVPGDGNVEKTQAGGNGASEVDTNRFRDLLNEGNAGKYHKRTESMQGETENIQPPVLEDNTAITATPAITVSVPSSEGPAINKPSNVTVVIKKENYPSTIEDTVLEENKTASPTTDVGIFSRTKEIENSQSEAKTTIIVDLSATKDKTMIEANKTSNLTIGSKISSTPEEVETNMVKDASTTEDNTMLETNKTANPTSIVGMSITEDNTMLEEENPTAIVYTSSTQAHTVFKASKTPIQKAKLETLSITEEIPSAAVDVLSITEDNTGYEENATASPTAILDTPVTEDDTGLEANKSISTARVDTLSITENTMFKANKTGNSPTKLEIVPIAEEIETLMLDSNKSTNPTDIVDLSVTEDNTVFETNETANPATEILSNKSINPKAIIDVFSVAHNNTLLGTNKSSNQTVIVDVAPVTDVDFLLESNKTATEVEISSITEETLVVTEDGTVFETNKSTNQTARVYALSITDDTVHQPNETARVDALSITDDTVHQPNKTASPTVADTSPITEVKIVHVGNISSNATALIYVSVLDDSSEVIATKSTNATVVENDTIEISKLTNATIPPVGLRNVSLEDDVGLKVLALNDEMIGLLKCSFNVVENESSPESTPSYRTGVCVDNNDCALKLNSYCSDINGASMCVCRPGYYDNNGHCQDSKKFSGKIRIIGCRNELVELHSDLQNTGSSLFDEMDAHFQVIISNVLSVTELAEYFLGSKVYGFKAGSLIVEFTTMFLPSQLVTRESIKDALIVAFAGLENITVDADSIYIEDYDECQSSWSNDCSTSATCVNTEGSFICQCLDGYTDPSPSFPGRECIDLNECDDPSTNDCSIYAECFNSDGLYTCRCNDGYVDSFENRIFYPGRNCTAICATDYCKNGGTCENDGVDKPLCKCTEQYNGIQCEVLITDDKDKYMIIAIAVSVVAAVLVVILCIMACCSWEKACCCFTNARRREANITMHDMYVGEGAAIKAVRRTSSGKSTRARDGSCKAVDVIRYSPYWETNLGGSIERPSKEERQRLAVDRDEGTESCGRQNYSMIGHHGSANVLSHETQPSIRTSAALVH